MRDLRRFLIAQIDYRESRVSDGYPIGWEYQIRYESAAMRRVVARCSPCRGGCESRPACRDCLVIAELAHVYRDNPDYREEWTP